MASIKSLHEKLRVDSGSFHQLQQGARSHSFSSRFAFVRAFFFTFSERKLTQNAKLFFSPGTRRETELHANIEARKTFTQQATENEMVLEELKSLEEGASVYKLIGPMLAKQDVVEATSNVTKRLEFINAER